jgi:hypothetical protein
MSELVPLTGIEEQINSRPAPVLPKYDARANTVSLDIQKQFNRAEIGKAVDIRPPATALLTINSADRYQPYSLASRYNNPGNGSPYQFTSPADFTLNLGASLMNGNFTRIAVTQINMLYTWPYISNSTNGIYINWQPGGSGTVTQYFVSLAYSPINSIPGGPAGQTALQVALQAAVRAATGSTTFTATANTPGLIYATTFQSGNTDKFYFSRWTSPTGPNAITLFDLLSFPASVVLSTSSFTLNQTNSFRTPYIDIVCEQITANQNLRDASTTSGGGKTLLARLPITSEGILAPTSSLTSAPYYITKTYPVPKQISWPANQPIGGSLRFQLLDAQGYVLTNGANYYDTGGNLGAFCDVNMGDWSMVLQVSEQ